MAMEDSPSIGRSPYISRRPRSSSVNGGGHIQSILDSPGLRAVENGALDIHDERSLRSISGRLGGSIRSPKPNRSLHLLSNEELMMHKLEAAAAADPTSTTTSPSCGEGTPLIDEDDFKASSISPPLILWIFPALSCAAAYAFYNIFIKKGSFTIHPILGGVILQFVAAILGLFLLAALVYKGDTGEIQYDRAGLLWSCWAGLAVGTAEMLSFCVSGMGVQASQSIPIIIGGSVAVGALLGLILLGEVLMFHGWFGVILLVGGIAMVATDPGDKVGEGGASPTEGIGITANQGPPLSTWIVPALCCAAAYAFYNIFIKKGSASINPILGGVILQFVAAFFGSLLLLLITIQKGGTSYLNYDTMGVVWSCLAGVAVGAAEMLSFCVSGMGVQASQSIPIVIGGSVAVGALLGLLMLGETLEYQGWVGVAALMVGIGFVATDPGEKMAGH